MDPSTIPPPAPWEPLLALMANGDQEAFAAFYDRFSGPFYRFVLAALKDSTQAERVVEDVFVDIWANSPSLAAHQAEFMPLIYKLLCHKVMRGARSGVRARDHSACAVG